MSFYKTVYDQTQGCSDTADNPRCPHINACRPYCPLLTILFSKCFSNDLLTLQSSLDGVSSILKNKTINVCPELKYLLVNLPWSFPTVNKVAVPEES